MQSLYKVERFDVTIRLFLNNISTNYANLFVAVVETKTKQKKELTSVIQKKQFPNYPFFIKHHRESWLKTFVEFPVYTQKQCVFSWDNEKGPDYFPKSLGFETTTCWKQWIFMNILGWELNGFSFFYKIKFTLCITVSSLKIYKYVFQFFSFKLILILRRLSVFTASKIIKYFNVDFPGRFRLKPIHYNTRYKGDYLQKRE